MSARNLKIIQKGRKVAEAVGTQFETILALRNPKDEKSNRNMSPRKCWSSASLMSAKLRSSIASAQGTLSMSQEILSQIRNLSTKNREICWSAWIVPTRSLTSQCVCMTVQAITVLRTCWIYTGKVSMRSFSSTASIAFRALIAYRTG